MYLQAQRSQSQMRNALSVMRKKERPYVATLDACVSIARC